jgi:hypothetical protein
MDLERAYEFVWTHGRLLERRLLERRLGEGSAAAVERAVLGYRNDDGGFAGVLEPDCRTPHSQPEAMRLALVVLDEIGCLDAVRARSFADWLSSVATAEGGVPFCLPTVEGYPRAPWWKPVPEPDLTPTGGLVGLLRPHAPEHPWVRRAADWCWARAGEGVPKSQYGVHALVEFLITEPDRERARPILDALGEALANGRVVPLDPSATPASPDTHTPLQFAPTPAHPLRRRFAGWVVDAFLDRLAAGQQDDGGWPIDWPAPGTTATYEWRAIRTLDALRTLSSYGRL